MGDDASDVVKFEIKHTKISRSNVYTVELMDMVISVFLCYKYNKSKVLEKNMSKRQFL